MVELGSRHAGVVVVKRKSNSKRTNFYPCWIDDKRRAQTKSASPPVWAEGGGREKANPWCVELVSSPLGIANQGPTSF